MIWDWLIAVSLLNEIVCSATQDENLQTWTKQPYSNRKGAKQRVVPAGTFPVISNRVLVGWKDTNKKCVLMQAVKNIKQTRSTCVIYWFASASWQHTSLSLYDFFLLNITDHKFIFVGVAEIVNHILHVSHRQKFHSCMLAYSTRMWFVLCNTIVWLHIIKLKLSLEIYSI